MPACLGACRDGSAVELIGLSASTLLWLDKMHRAGLYPHSGVTGLYNGESAHTRLCACINLGIELCKCLFLTSKWVLKFVDFFISANYLTEIEFFLFS